MKLLEIAPGKRLAGAAALGCLVIGAVLWLAIERPWLGLTFSWDPGSQSAIVLAGTGPGAAVPAGARLVMISGAGLSHRFIELDFSIEPDGNLATYREYRAFLRNQGLLASIQAAPVIELTADDGAIYELRPQPRRPPGTLPPDFWVQVAVGFLAWMIAAAVWAFRPHEASARYLLLSGAMTLMFAPGAAVYTTRELAVPLTELLLLKTMNFGGGLVFCASMIALMLNYPRRIAWRGLSVLVIAAYSGWFVAQALGAFDSMMLGRRIPVFAALLAATALAITQWVRARRDPIARAALRWFLLSWLIGVNLFVLLTMVPQILEIRTGAVQGYSFLLFLLIYGGIALGILRYRLFDLGIWWFRTLAWIIGAIALVALDLLFLLVMQLSSGWSLSLSLLVCSLLWLPFRNWLWSRTLLRAPASDNLFKSVVHVALAPTAGERAARWEALLRSLFDPLEIKPVAAGPQVTSDRDGASLTVPAVAQSPALQMLYPGGGRRLFTPADLKLADQLTDMLRYAEESREAYAQGARAERSRIARDLHDDIGSLLLSGMYQPDLNRARHSMAQAIGEMRVILRGLTGEQYPLDIVEADLRHELGERLEAVGIALDWQGCDESASRATLLSHGVYKNLLSAVRELVSNVMRHAEASRLGVAMRLAGDRLEVVIADDGRGFSAEAVQGKGQGLGNLRRRLEGLGGTVRYGSTGRGVVVSLDIPLRSAGEQAIGLVDDRLR